jgi:hypothetical protein
MRKFYFALGLLALSLLFASLVKLAVCVQTGHWRDGWAIAAAVFVLRLFPWPWNRRRRRRGIVIRF